MAADTRCARASTSRDEPPATGVVAVGSGVADKEEEEVEVPEDEGCNDDGCDGSDDELDAGCDGELKWRCGELKWGRDGV